MGERTPVWRVAANILINSCGQPTRCGSAPSQEKSDDSKDSLYEELKQVLDHCPKWHMQNPLRDFNAKVGRENIFKMTIRNESLHQDSNDNWVRIVNFATTKKSSC